MGFYRFHTDSPRRALKVDPQSRTLNRIPHDTVLPTVQYQRRCAISEARALDAMKKQKNKKLTTLCGGATAGFASSCPAGYAGLSQCAAFGIVIRVRHPRCNP